MIQDVQAASTKVGVMTLMTRILNMTNETIDNNQIGNDTVEHNCYLEQQITIEKRKQELEIATRMRKTWTTYPKNNYVLLMNIQLQMEEGLWNSYFNE